MVETLDPIVAEMRRVRLERGLTLRAMAELIGGVSHQTVERWESGRHEPTISHARDIARVLGCNVVLVPNAGGEP